MKRSAQSTTFLTLAVLALGAATFWPSQAPAAEGGPLVLSLDASTMFEVDGTTPRANANGDPLAATNSDGVILWGQEYGASGYVPFLLDPFGLPEDAPAYNSSGLNGLPTVDFFKSAFDFMEADLATLFGKLIPENSPGGVDEYTVFFVVDAQDGNGTAFSQQAFSTSGSLSMRNTANWQARIGGSSGGPAANGFFDSGDPTSSGFKVRSFAGTDDITTGNRFLEAQRSGNPTSSIAFFQENFGEEGKFTWDIAGTETEIADTDHGINAPGVFTLGNRKTPLNHPANAKIAQIAIFDEALSVDARTGINSVLATKWGLPDPGATPEQKDLANTLLTQPPAKRPPPPIANYQFANGQTSGAISSVESSDTEDNSTASNYTTGGSELISSAAGNPARSAFFGAIDTGNDLEDALRKDWVSIAEIGPGVPMTVSSLAPAGATFSDGTPYTDPVDRDYFQFSVVANGGFEMDLDKVTFDLQRDTIEGIDSWGLYYDLGAPGDNNGDEFTTKIAGETGADIPPTVDTPGASINDFTTSELDLTGIPELQGVTDFVTFRLYFWHDGEFSNDVWQADFDALTGNPSDPPLLRSNARLDNVMVIGEVMEIGGGAAAVPEPAGAVLLLLGALLCRGRPRRH